LILWSDSQIIGAIGQFCRRSTCRWWKSTAIIPCFDIVVEDHLLWAFDPGVIYRLVKA